MRLVDGGRTRARRAADDRGPRHDRPRCFPQAAPFGAAVGAPHRAVRRRASGPTLMYVHAAMFVGFAVLIVGPVVLPRERHVRAELAERGATG